MGDFQKFEGSLRDDHTLQSTFSLQDLMSSPEYSETEVMKHIKDLSRQKYATFPPIMPSKLREREKAH